MRLLCSTCAGCGNDFSYEYKGGNKSKFCSRGCRAAHKAAYQKAYMEHEGNRARRQTRLKSAGYQQTDRSRRLRVLYGISPDDYTAILEKQGGCCGICGSTEPGGKYQKFHVDHSHVSGKVRGLLCHSCNVGLGHFKDQSALIQAALYYLEANDG